MKKKKKKKTHIARHDHTACGRSVRGLELSHHGTSAPFVLLKADARERIIAATTCKRCLLSRYNA